MFPAGNGGTMIVEPAKKLHTVQSRNHQVVRDLRLWCHTEWTDRISICKSRNATGSNTELRTRGVMVVLRPTMVGQNDASHKQPCILDRSGMPLVAEIIEKGAGTFAEHGPEHTEKKVAKGVEEEGAQLKNQLNEYEEKDVSAKYAEYEGRASSSHQRSLELEDLIQTSHSKAESAGDQGAGVGDARTWELKEQTATNYVVEKLFRSWESPSATDRVIRELITQMSEYRRPRHGWLRRRAVEQGSGGGMQLPEESLKGCALGWRR